MPPSAHDDESAGEVRHAILAGRWYPASARELERELLQFYQSVPAEPPEHSLRAVIVPHAGYRYSGATAAHGYKGVAAATIDRVILLGPSHHDAFHGLALLDVDAFETPLGRLPVDRQVVRDLMTAAPFVARPQAHAQEHALEIQLPFLQTSGARRAAIVPIVVGRLDDETRRLAAARLRTVADASTLIVVSSDYTHYGEAFDYQPFGSGADVPARIEQLDRGAIDCILQRDGEAFRAYRERTGATICGARPIELFLQMSASEHLEGELCAYTQSGELTGDFEHCVSYAAIRFRDVGRLTRADAEQLLSLAWSALRGALLGTVAERAEPRPPLDRVRGVFVTLRQHGALRGCVGQLEPSTALGLAVQEATVSAARHDPRFPPITAAELDELEMEISVLSPLVAVKHPDEIVIGRDGLLAVSGKRRGTLLPQVAVEHGFDAGAFVRRTLRKAGLPEDAIERGEDVLLYRYEAQVLTAADLR